VEELLASPRYGERWAQHWLDLVRYADTHGFEVNTERPHAWPYRDYVIRAFNQDTPYDQFAREQIIGDLLGEDAATGFLITASALLPGQIGSDEPSKRLARQDALDEIVVNISQTFLGLSVGCARCHNHKFDPISQRDYYSMQAFVAGVEYEDREMRTPEAERLRLQEAQQKAQLAEVDRQLARFDAVADSGHDRPQANARMHIDEKAFLASLKPEETEEATRLLERKKSLERKIRGFTQGRLAFAGRFRKPDRIYVLNRGDPEQPRDEVQPAVLGVIGGPELSPDAADPERRRALAEWIASPQNPLTARVMANRVWQGHFGAGIVPTPSDFGTNGQRPSHPELLDWLAGEFVRSDWSVKHLHRLIVLSAAYRQSNRIDPAAAAVDSEARLLWRSPSRRLESEAIRDAMLAVSGKLYLKMYGRGFDLFDQRGGLSGFKPVESFTGEGLRRMIYAHKVRRERDPVFGAFDCPDAGQSTDRRRESTTPIQALNLWNSRYTIDISEAFALRVRNEAGTDLSDQIRRCYALAFCRAPSAEELVDALAAVREHGLTTLCRVLFNSNEFVTLP
jgi:hypothetical protein